MKRLLRVLIVFSLLDVFGLGFLWFAYSTILAKQNEEVILRKDIANEKQKGMSFMSTQKTATQAQKESGALNKYLYDQGEESQINFVAQMEALGIATSHATVEVKSLDLTGEGTQGFRGELTVRGTWKEVYHLLRLVETFPAHIVINRFSVTASDKRNASTAVWSGGANIDLIGLKSP